MNNNTMYYNIVKSFKLDKDLYKSMMKRIKYLNTSISDYIRSLIINDITSNTENEIAKKIDINSKLLLLILWYVGGVYDLEKVDAEILNKKFKENLKKIGIENSDI